MGLLLLCLCITGIFVWWPGVRRITQSLAVKSGRGRYRRDRDLHRVVGLAVLPFLLIWALTGASFEFPFVADAAYALQGQHPPVSPSLSSRPGKGPDISFAQAEQAALRVTHGVARRRLQSSRQQSGGRLPDRHRQGPERLVLQHELTVEPGGLGRPARPGPRPAHLQQPGRNPRGVPVRRLGSAWHFGYPFNPWLRLVLFLAGLSPLLLMVTGLSTLLLRRGLAADGYRRVLAALYLLFALAASARAGFQLCVQYHRAPLAYLLSAVAGIIYVAGAVAIRHTSTQAGGALSSLPPLSWPAS